MKITYRSMIAFLLCTVFFVSISACKKAEPETNAACLHVVSSIPAAEEEGVTSSLASIVLNFDQALRASVNMEKISLKEKNSERPVVLSSAETSENGLFITVAEKLSPETSYILHLDSGAVSSITDFTMEEYFLTFTTGYTQQTDIQPPVLLQTYPENNEKNFDPLGELILLFNEPIMQGANYEQISLISSDNSQISFTKNIVGSQFIIQAQLKTDSVYTLIVPGNAVRDYAINDFTEPIYLEFTTAKRMEETNAAPIKSLNTVATIPQDGLTNVNVSTIISVMFGSSVQKGSAFASVSVIPVDGGDNCITGKAFSEHTLRINAALKPATTYLVTVPKDAVQNAQGIGNTEKIFRFTTAQPKSTPAIPENHFPAKDVQPPQIILSVPKENETNVSAKLTQIRICFQENIVQGQAFFDCKLIDVSGGEVPVFFGISGSMVTVSLRNPLKANTLYTLTIPAQAVADMAGNTAAQAWNLSFTTGKEEEITTQSSISITTEQTTETHTEISDVQEPKIIHFAGKEYPEGTKAITVQDMPLTDLSALTQFKNLESLTLINTSISDISVLASLKNLKYLNLESNQISNLNPLASLHELQNLNLRFNLVKDVSALTGLTGLEELILSDNDITDISGLQTLTGLKKLSITNNMITSVEALSNMKQIEILAAEFNQITDVTPLAGMSQLQTLYLSKNHLKDVSALSSLQELKNLLLSSNQITDTAGLEKLKNLDSLYLSDNPLTQTQIGNLKLKLTGCKVVF